MYFKDHPAFTTDPYSWLKEQYLMAFMLPHVQVTFEIPNFTLSGMVIRKFSTEEAFQHHENRKPSRWVRYLSKSRDFTISL